MRQEEKVQLAESAAVATELVEVEANVPVLMPEPQL